MGAIVMRGLHCALLATVAAVSFASVASAADMPVKSPVYKAPMVAPLTWTGCYIGGNIGGAWSHKDFQSPGLTRENGGEHTADGWVGGGQIGCDYQFTTNWVIGIQGMFDAANLNGSNVIPGFPAETWSTKVTSFGTAGARLGYLFTPTTLFYGKAGVGFVNDKSTFADSSSTYMPSETATRIGFDAGVGLAWMFAPNWDIFIEYDHIFLGNKTLDFTLLSGAISPTIIGQSFDKALVGIDYRFGSH